MGLSTVTAARIFDGQSEGKKGEEHALAFEDFDHLALIKTYNTNAQVPDSAGTATAILSGYKTNIGAVNVRPSPNPELMVKESCIDKASPPLIAELAKAHNMKMGTVTTTRITHATPAATYGHAANRDWEADKDIIDDGADKAGCTSLAAQLIDSDLDLALGGGAKEFTGAQIETWKNRGHIYVQTANELKASPKDAPILGLFNRSHMSFEADRDGTQEPSLAEMTNFAIDRLSNENGFVLMVEAGRVDHAHHGINAYRALRDMQALNEAVKTAKAKTGKDTLILVTADHSHVFTMGGYAARGNPILGLVKNPAEVSRMLGEEETTYAKDKDGKPYTTLGYYNGPNTRSADSKALTSNAVQAPNFRQQTAVNLGSETHSGEDVPLYARGPGAQNFKGVMEQDEIGRILHELIGE